MFGISPVRVTFEKDRTIITINYNNDNTSYFVEMHNCNNTAGMLNRILEVSEQPWCTFNILSEFIRVANYACNTIFQKDIRGVFCQYETNVENIVWE